MTSTLSAQGQLLAGLEYTLTKPTTGLTAAGTNALSATDPLRYAFPPEDLVARVQNGTLGIFPFIVITLGKEARDPAAGTGGAFGGGGNRTGPTQPDGTATTLIATDRWLAPLTLEIVAGGQAGLAVADRVRTLVKAALRAVALGRQSTQTTATPQLIIPLPDDLETAATVPGPNYHLSAALDDLGALWVPNDAPRLLYRLQLQYRAHYSEYRQDVATIAQGVQPTYQSGIFQPIIISPL